jgi:hypothetical protein
VKRNAPRDYRGFYLSRTGGPDAPWIARHDDGRKVRADTLAGVKGMVREEGP